MPYGTLKVNMIVAAADNLAIGRGNDMPWHLSEDLKYFKKTTSGHTVIMGRRTFESIGRPLPKRRNIVISRNPSASGLTGVDGIECLSSLEEALDRCSQDAEKEVFIIGGGSIYAQAMKYADMIYLTHVHAEINDADTYFPEFASEEWKILSSSPEMKDEESGLIFNFEVFGRVCP